MAAEIYLDGAWRTPREVYLDGAWRSLEDLYLYGAWRGAGGGPDGPPDNLVAVNWSACSGGFAQYRVRLAWLSGDADASTRIYRNGSLIGQVAAGVTQYTDTTLSGPGSYTYKARHYLNGIESADSNAPTINLTNPCAP